MRILFRASSNSDQESIWCTHCIVDLDFFQVQYLQTRRYAYEKTAKLADDVTSITFGNMLGDFYDRIDEKLLSEDAEHALEAIGYTEIPEELFATVDTARIDYSELVIDNDGFWFTCRPKHTGVIMETAKFSFDELDVIDTTDTDEETNEEVDSDV